MCDSQGSIHIWHKVESTNNLYLSVIANLSTRLNAVKTLESRIRLIRSFLENLPPSASDGKTSQSTQSILRNISALVSGLSLLTPQDSKSFAVESLAQENDVALISLLGRLGENVNRTRVFHQESTTSWVKVRSRILTLAGCNWCKTTNRLWEMRNDFYGLLGVQFPTSQIDISKWLTTCYTQQIPKWQQLSLTLI